MAKKTKKEEVKVIFHNEDADKSIENLLTLLYRLQKIESKIDRIRQIRGELPEQVQDLEDSIEGLKTRIEHKREEKKEIESRLAGYRTEAAQFREQIAKYKEQQNKSKNSREYESFQDEINYAALEIELRDKKIKNANSEAESFDANIAESEAVLAEKEEILKEKKTSLDDIIKETHEQEDQYLQKKAEVEKELENTERAGRYFEAYKRLRAANENKNGLAIVPVERDACGGCFNKVTHQRQMDIKMHKKVIACEYCGRILIDESISEVVDKEEL